MDLTKTKGQRWVGRAGRECHIQTSTKADGKGVWIRHSTGVRTTWLLCGAGCWGLTRGNITTESWVKPY